jgi:hypothetical protein
MDDPLWRAIVLCVADVESVAISTVVAGNMHDVAAESEVVNSTSHLRREE